MEWLVTFGVLAILGIIIIYVFTARGKNGDDS